MDTLEDPLAQQARKTLKTAIFWIFGCAAIAVFAGVAVKPPISYTVGAALLGGIWAAFLVLLWRTKCSFWNAIALVVLAFGLSILRDSVFPGRGILRVIYGFAVAITAGMLLFRMFRRPVERFCGLIDDDPSADHHG
ncbi:hypothetical protein ACXR0O_23460 [Verrucomicrobiota bacterium sgz303538]